MWYKGLSHEQSPVLSGRLIACEFLINFVESFLCRKKELEEAFASCLYAVHLSPVSRDSQSDIKTSPEYCTNMQTALSTEIQIRMKDFVLILNTNNLFLEQVMQVQLGLARLAERTHHLHSAQVLSRFKISEVFIFLCS